MLRKNALLPLKSDITQAEKDKALELIQIWRARLYDLGWYMRCLNENIAVQANKEDNCYC